MALFIGRKGNRHPTGNIAFQAAFKSLLSHCQGFLMGKSAGHNIGHIGELGYILIPFFFDGTIIGHILSLAVMVLIYNIYIVLSREIFTIFCHLMRKFSFLIFFDFFNRFFA
jgi:hypothetical protein